MALKRRSTYNFSQTVHNFFKNKHLNWYSVWCFSGVYFKNCQDLCIWVWTEIKTVGYLKISKLPCNSKHLSVGGKSLLFQLPVFLTLRFSFWLHLLFREMGRLRTYSSIFQFLVHIQNLYLFTFQFCLSPLTPFGIERVSNASYKINSYLIICACTGVF